LQSYRNRDQQKLASERGKGIVGTLILHLGILAMLVIVGFSAPKSSEPEKGILVNFGTDETGSGLIEPSRLNHRMKLPLLDLTNQQPNPRIKMLCSLRTLIKSRLQ